MKSLGSQQLHCSLVSRAQSASRDRRRPRGARTLRLFFLPLTACAWSTLLVNVRRVRVRARASVSVCVRRARIPAFNEKKKKKTQCRANTLQIWRRGNWTSIRSSPGFQRVSCIPLRIYFFTLFNVIPKRCLRRYMQKIARYLVYRGCFFPPHSRGPFCEEQLTCRSHL